MRWVYLEIVENKSATRTGACFDRLVVKYPFRIVKILTDNGKEWSDRFCSYGEFEPTGKRPFHVVGAKENTEHRLSQSRKIQINGRLGRFNGRSHEILKVTGTDSSHDLKSSLERYPAHL